MSDTKSTISRRTMMQIAAAGAAASVLPVITLAAPQSPTTLIPTRVKIDTILDVVARGSNVAVEEILSPDRTRRVVEPRQIGMYLAHRLTARSLPEIGRRFGGRDHTTVLHAARKIARPLPEHKHLADKARRVLAQIESTMAARGQAIDWSGTRSDADLWKRDAGRNLQFDVWLDRRKLDSLRSKA